MQTLERRGEARAPPAPAAEPGLLLASSGSQGRPKLIHRPERTFFHRLEWTWATLPFESSEAVVQKSCASRPRNLLQSDMIEFEGERQGTIRSIRKFW